MKPVAYENMSRMVVTELVFQLPMYWLKPQTVAPAEQLNMTSILSAALVFQAPIGLRLHRLLSNVQRRAQTVAAFEALKVGQCLSDPSRRSRTFY